MKRMRASFNPRLHQQHPDNRTNCRYRLARLLLLEQFDQALREAEVALGQQDILPEDLRFVRDIVEDAKRHKPPFLDSNDEFIDTPCNDFTTESNRHDNSR